MTGTSHQMFGPSGLASLSVLAEKHSGNMKLLLLESLNHSKLIQLNENNNGWITFVYTTSLHLIDWAHRDKRPNP